MMQHKRQLLPLSFVLPDKQEKLFIVVLCKRMLVLILATMSLSEPGQMAFLGHLAKAKKERKKELEWI
jgi:hypothetical protein